MLESLVASILNRFLGNYVSNLNYDQLNIGIWSGEANLRDLKLRREALDKLDLPINVLEGYLGQLTLSIPWSNLKTKPVKVFVENVYLLAVPKTESTISLEEEEERAQLLKQRRLATAELLSNASSKKDGQKEQQTDEGNDGFISQLTTKIIDNLQVSIKNIHVRFEDNVSDPGHPFAAGITLKELSAVSTDGEWNPTFISEMTNTIHKLATLHSLSAYWNTDAQSLAGMPHEEAAQVFTDLIPDGLEDSTNDPQHQYILKPVSGTGKVKLNKLFGKDVAKTDVTLLFEELGICLDDHQYRDAILLVDLFHANLKKQKYLKFHPEKGATPKSNPRAYWKFAQEAVLSEIHERHYKWSWDHFRTRRDQRRAYIECYTATKMNKATAEQKEQLEKLEKDLSFDDIRFYRSLARSKLKREKIKIEQEKKKAESENKGWFSSWWSSSSEKSSDTGDENEPIVMTEEQKRELYDAIDYDEEKATIAAAVDMPKDTMKLSINTKLKRGSLSLMSHVENDQARHDLASLVFDTVTTDVVQYIESAKIGVTLGDLRLYDNLTPNTIYPQLIGARNRDGTGRSLAEIRTTNDESLSSALDTPIINANSEPLFNAVIEHKPFNNIADNAIKLSTKRLEIIYNPEIVKGIMEFFKPPENQSESINALLAVAGDTFEEFRQQTRAGLEYALDQHTTLALDIDMDAPVFIIPESCTKRNTACMIIDTGHIHVDSELADPNLVHELKNKKHTREDYQKLESLMYDKFKVGLSQTKLLIATDVDDCLAQLQGKRDGHAHVIERIDMHFLVELCILQRAAQFTKFKVSGNLPLLSLSVSDTKYKILMRMIDLILDSIFDDDNNPKPQDQTNDEKLQQQQQQVYDYLQTSWTDKNNRNDLWLSDTDSEVSVPPSLNIQRQDSSEPYTPLSSSTSSYMMGGGKLHQQEQFRFTFQVDKVAATVYETASDGTDKLLCELILETFMLEFLNRPYDMLVDVSLRLLNIVDNMEHGDEFHYLVTSDSAHGKRPPNKNLVQVKYMQVNRSHPLYQEMYQGFDQTVEIALSTLNIVVTRSSILTLYNFILNTFTAPPQSSEESTDDQHDTTVLAKSAKRLSSSSAAIATTTTKGTSEEKKTDTNAAPSSNTIKVTIHMDSLDLILNDDGKRLGTGILSYGDLTVLLYPNTLKVSGKFGKFSLTDDTVIHDHNLLKDIEYNGSDVYLLTIQGDELADFVYETFDRASDSFPGYDSRFYLHMGALQFLFLDSAMTTLGFLNEFLEMKTVYDAAREAAAQQMQETDSRMHFDITVKSPVVIFPVSDKDDTVIANLGEIRAANEFINVMRRRTYDLTAEPKELSMSKILCGLYTISLQSRSIVKVRGQQHERILPIIDNLDITFDIQSPEKAAPEWGPATSIIGHVSDIRMALTENQFKWLLDIYNKVMGILFPGDGNNTTDDTEDDDDYLATSIHSSPPRQSQLIHDNQKGPAIDNDKKNKNIKSPVAIQVDMVMDVKTVCLEILTGPDRDFKDWERQRLARLAFNGTSMKLQTHSDASLLLEVEMNSVTFTDTRSDSKSQFKEIMSASHLEGSPQLQVLLRMPAQNEEQIMFVRATIDSPKIVLSLDYVFLLVNFFMKPFAPEPTTEAQAFAKSQRERLNRVTGGKQLESRRKSITGSTNGADKKNARSIASSKKPKQQQQQPMELHFNVDIIDVQVACLANPEVSSSEAIIFSFKQLSAIQDKAMSCKLDRIGMVLCRMDVRDESAVPFVQEFDIDLKMKTSSNMPGCNITVINIDVQPLIIRLSYNDAMLVIDIINKAIALMGTGNQTPPGAAGYDDGSFNNQRLVLPDEGGINLDDENLENIWAMSRTQKIEPYIVMTKESLKAQFQGLQFVLIEDLHDLPFIDAMLQPFTVNASDWSSALSADVFLNISASSYNFRNSHWEPVIEPWGFGIKIAQDVATKSMQLAVESEEFLNLDITHAFLETMLTVSGSMFEDQPLPEGGQKQVRPYLICNRTGHDLRFWNMSDDAHKEGSVDNRMNTLKDGEEMPWIFRDWKRRREQTKMGKNLLGVQVEAFEWQKFQHIPLDQEGQHSYRIKPEVKGIQHRLIVDIQLKNHVKHVTFRSGLVIQNCAAEDIKVLMVNSKRRIVSPEWTITPGGECVVPIELVYNYWMVAKPAKGNYHWSKPAIHWSDVTHPDGPRSISCDPSSSEKDAFIYQINGIFDKLNPVAIEYPIMAIQLDAPIELENMLPYPVALEMVDKTQGISFRNTIPVGEACHIHTIDTYHHVAIGIEVPEAGKCYMTTQLIDLDLDEDAKESTRIQAIELLDKDGLHPINLHLSIARLSKSNNALFINIFTPYLILNKTRQALSLKSCISHRKSKHVEYDIPATPTSDQTIKPYMFSFPEMNRKNRVQLSTNDSKWSEELSFEAVGSVQDVILPTAGNVHQIHLGVHVEEGVGMYHMTRMIIISPRFILKNNLGMDIKYREFGMPIDDFMLTLKPEQRAPLYNLSKSNIRWLCLCRAEEGGIWSSPFDIQQIGDTHIKLEVDGENRPILVRVSVVLEGAAIFVFLEPEENWPYLIINMSSVPVTFSQTDTSLDEYKLKDRQRKALPPAREFSLGPHDRMDYSWCMPVAHDKRIQLDVFGKKRDVNFQAIGTQMPIRYKRQAHQHRSGSITSRPIMSIDVIARDSALVLVLSDFNPEISLYQPKSSSASVSASSRDGSSREGSLRDTFETVDVEHIINYSFELNLAGIGISIVNKRMQEMAYVTIRALDFKYTDSNLFQSVRTSIQWLQVDNQFHGSLHPILCFPSTLPKNITEQQTHPTFHMALDKIKDEAHGVHNFKVFSILLQEMTFAVDEDFLFCLMEFAQFSTNQHETHIDEKALFSMEVAEPVVQNTPALYYFQEFCIQPMRLNLSFSRTDRINAIDEDDDVGRSPLRYAFDVFTMTIGNVNDAPIKLNALIVENLRVSYEDLMERVVLHYRGEVIYQVHKVLGSVDVIGNPVGFFTTIGSGFGELFYEPYQGFIMSDRPQDLGIGIARGVGGFAKNFVFGISDSMSRITGSFGKGLSAATLDKKFQDRRRVNLTRNKPQHAFYGISQGVGYFGLSIASGFAGLYKRPLEGAESGGVLGFAEGVGRGLVGVVTKPLVGFFDMASNVTAGVRETTMIFDPNDITRERLPRYVGIDGILRPYTQREALGQLWLKELKGARYFNDRYIAHSTAQSDEMIAILTYQRILYVGIRKGDIEYDILLDQIHECNSSVEGIHLNIKQATARTVTLPIEEKTSREWFASQIQTIMDQRKEDKERQ
ncbi:hypothetical protein BDA99DRAFT_569176 [Phascolomyces articulosus]|uniref:Vacuolar protein sorting-associated protein n=1 Tax=Phascolomyces articulosus TaxID=60185 RepID=A0AAD5KJP3_9FUNG|nr:hypothetical protein BDA99DRAFT_569176 [Phascolomyces articulosus]